jgi:hypothetical protein
MIFLIGSGGGGSPAAAGSWSFGLATALPATVTPSSILAIVADASVDYCLANEAPDSPSSGDVWFHVTDPEAERLMTNGANDFDCWGAYQWSGTAWVLLTTYKSFLGSWAELPGLPPIGTALSACTWDQINRIGAAGRQADYFSIGDEKSITLSTSEVITLQIIGFSHDNLSGGGGGKAPITFAFKTCMNTTQSMNATNTNVGGYSGCALYSTINGAIYGSLPADLRAVMKNVSKLTSAGNQSATIVTTQEKLFLLSEVEIFGSITYSKSGEGTQYAFFTNGGARSKTVGGVASTWWERSPIGDSATYFCAVTSSGAVYYYGASDSYGVALGLCV